MNPDNKYDQQGIGFLAWTIATVCLGVVGVVVFVICIDPYNLYGWCKLDKINVVKPGLTRYVEEIKLTQVLKLQPDTLIFGNSRAEIGFDPESQAFVSRGYSAYNLAIRGTSIESSYRQLDYLLNKGLKPKRILIGLDFVDFMNASPGLEGQPKPVLSKQVTFPVDNWFWWFDSVFSMASITDALRTVGIQDDAEASVVTARGFNPLQEYLPMARNEGYYALFRQRAEENARIYLKKSAGKLDNSDLIYLRAILDAAVNAGSDVVVIIYPYHAQIMALFESTGLLPKFNQWKNQVVTEVAGVKLETKRVAVNVVDFSGYGDRQCERIPEKGNLRQVTQWYWEAGHFKKQLGDLVMERSLSLITNSQALPLGDSDFGMVLSQTNLDKNLARMRKQKITCSESYPQLFEMADEVVRALHG